MNEYRSLFHDDAMAAAAADSGASTAPTAQPSRRGSRPAAEAAAAPSPAAPSPDASRAAALLDEWQGDSRFGSFEDTSAAGAPSMDARAVWQKVMGELQLQLNASTYYTWLHDTWIEAYEDGDFIVGTPNTYARDWLENRLRTLVRKTLKSIVGRTVDVRFVVRPRRLQDAPNARPAPLYSSAPAEPSPAPAPRAEGTAARAGPATRARAGLPAHSQLNPLYTFDSFIVGNSNRFACAAAQAIAEKPGHKFNPLFVYGGVGLGKTHLLHAIGNTLNGSGYQVLYCTSEQFTNELISAIRTQNTEQFRNKYRESDVLLIDDIQFIAGKESTQEEVFHTFNHLQSFGKQVVISSDRPPKALQPLEERLRSRFEGGIQVDVSAPDFETRVAILQSKAARMGIDVDIAVLKMVAERVDSNIRELEGALNHLFLHAQMARTSLDLAVASHTLDNVAPPRKPCSAPKVIELVAEHYGLETEEVTGPRRTRAIADARHVAMYLLREELSLSLPQIGGLIGGRDHTTVAHGIEKIGGELRANEQLRRDISALRDKVYTPFAG